MLPQGHTHDEVDALFKMINTYLAGNNCHSYEEFIEALTGITFILLLLLLLLLLLFL